MSLRKTLLIASCAALLPITSACGQDISLSFNNGDGFATGSFAPTVVASAVPGFSAEFSLGQQQQFFDGGSYEAGPAAYVFVNGTFNGVSGDGINDDAGQIDFTGNGATEVTFFGANRGFGGGVAVNVFGVDDTTLLNSFAITQTTLAGSPVQTVLSESDFGAAIGRIVFDLPGPATPVANPPYVLAIDTFTATAATATAVPEPSTAAFFAFGMCAIAAYRRRQS